MQRPKRQAFGTLKPLETRTGLCDDVVYGVSFLKIGHTYHERCCGKIIGFTPTPLLFIALNGTEVISEHRGRGFGTTKPHFSQKVSLSLTLCTV